MDFMLGLGLRRFLLGLLFAAMGRLHGQSLDFHHRVTLAGKPLVLNQWTVLPGGLECKVDVMRWYVTPYFVRRGQKRVGDAWLLDLADSASLQRQVYARKVDFAVLLWFVVVLLVACCLLVVQFFGCCLLLGLWCCSAAGGGNKDVWPPTFS